MKSKLWLCLWAAFLTAGAPANALAADKPAAEADSAWKAVQKALRPPIPPAEWQTNRPAPEEIQKFQLRQGVLAAEAAEK